MMKEDIKEETTTEVTVTTSDDGRGNVATDTVYTKSLEIENPGQLQQEKVQSIVNSREHDVLNGYQLGIYIVKTSFDKFAMDDLAEPPFYAFLCYLFVLIISGLVSYFSFWDKHKIVCFLNYCNLLFIITPLVIFYAINLLEDIHQIKIGYYLFIINTIAIIAVSKKAMRTNNLPNAV